MREDDGEMDESGGGTKSYLPPSATRRIKKPTTLTSFVKKSIKRTFSNSSGGSGVSRLFSPSNTDDYYDDDDEDVDTEEPITCTTIPLSVGVEAVPMAEDRVVSILQKTRFVKRKSRLFGTCIPAFSKHNFQLGALVGRGGFATVHKLQAWNDCTSDLNEDDNFGKQYVVKRLRADGACTPERLAMMAADLVMEAHILSALEHVHILPLQGISTGGLSSLKTGHIDGLFLILDYLPCTLYRRLVEWQKAEFEREEQQLQAATPIYSSSLPQRLQAAVDLASALAYLHSKGIIYRDLKPSNVGFDVNGTLKLFDFGLAVDIPISKSDPNKTYHLVGRKGTARYMAPEVAKRKPYNAKADVFSMAILTWQLLALCKPFANQTTSDTVSQKIVGGERPALKYLPASSLQAKTLVSLQRLLTNGWSKHIADRPTMKEMHTQLRQMAQVEVGTDSGN